MSANSKSLCLGKSVCSPRSSRSSRSRIRSRVISAREAPRLRASAGAVPRCSPALPRRATRSNHSTARPTRSIAIAGTSSSSISGPRGAPRAAARRRTSNGFTRRSARRGSWCSASIRASRRRPPGTSRAILLDEAQQYGRAYAAVGLPTSLVVDPSGHIVRGIDGQLTLAEMHDAVDSVLRAARTER